MTTTLELPTTDLLDLTGDPHCHLYEMDGHAPTSLCGVPRGEQPHHLTRGSQTDSHCAGCGLQRCPTCLRKEAQRNYWSRFH